MRGPFRQLKRTKWLLHKLPAWYFYVPALVLGLMFLPAALMWSSMPSSQVTAVVYDQRSDSFSLETEPVRWWFRPEPAKRLALFTENEQGRVEGFIPYARYYELELVPIGEANTRGIIPDQSSIQPPAPEGQVYQFRSWPCPASVVYKYGSWAITYGSAIIVDPHPGRALTVVQSEWNPLITGPNPAYSMRVYGQSGIGFCGTGMIDMSAFKRGPLARFERAMDHFTWVFNN